MGSISVRAMPMKSKRRFVTGAVAFWSATTSSNLTRRYLGDGQLDQAQDCPCGCGKGFVECFFRGLPFMTSAGFLGFLTPPPPSSAISVLFVRKIGQFLDPLPPFSADVINGSPLIEHPADSQMLLGHRETFPLAFSCPSGYNNLRRYDGQMEP